MKKIMRKFPLENGVGNVQCTVVSALYVRKIPLHFLPTQITYVESKKGRTWPFWFRGHNLEIPTYFIVKLLASPPDTNSLFPITIPHRHHGIRSRPRSVLIASTHLPLIHRHLPIICRHRLSDLVAAICSLSSESLPLEQG